VTTDQETLTRDEQAVRDAVVQSNAAWTAAMDTASPAGLAAIKTGSNLASTLASVAALREQGQHYRIQLDVLEVIWAKVVGADQAEALVRKINEHRVLYQRGHAHPVSDDKSSYATLYDLVRQGGRWLVTLTRILDDATAARLTAAPPDATSGPVTLNGTATPVSPATAAAGSVQSATAHILPSVVRVDAPNALGTATGTGFIVASTDTGSYILTNDHVVQDSTAALIQVTLSDGTRLTTTGMEENPGDDLAILAVQETHLPVVTWAPHESEALGEAVIAIGYAAGMQGPPSVTTGVLSALDRALDNGLTYLQHSAQINPGNSGGPLADLQGRVLGVNSYSLNETQGIFFAIPGERARPVVRDLIAHLSSAEAAPSEGVVPSGESAATPVASGMDPVSVVQAFNEALNAHDYGTAFSYFTRRLQGQIGDEGAWAAQLSDEQSVSVTSATLVSQTPLAAVVSLTLTSTWSSGDAARDFAGTWRLLYGQRGWRLDAPDLSRVHA
jgi:S1-C subfamily serine protease